MYGKSIWIDSTSSILQTVKSYQEQAIIIFKEYHIQRRLITFNKLILSINVS